MKIVCDKCQTKYSIADDKVRSKVFKIRCKKCSNVIVVNSDGAAVDPTSADAASAETSDAAAGDEAIWYLVLGGEQAGPFTPAEVRAKVAGGEADGECYAWCEAFGADWKRLASIDEFSDLDEVTSHGANGHVTPAADAFTAASAGADLFAAADAHAESPFASSSADATPFTDATAGSAQAASAGDVRLTGQRNENSALFSLNNLQALATSGGAKSAATPAVEPRERAGYATSKNEGSGLIDIRAMAAATLSSVGPTTTTTEAPVEIPSFSAAPVLAPVVAAPVLVPAPQQQGGTPKWVWGVIGGLGAAVLLAGGVLLTRGNEPAPVVPSPAQAVQATQPAPTAQAGTTAAPVVAAPTEAAKPTEPSPTEATNTAEPTKAEPAAAKHERTVAVAAKRATGKRTTAETARTEAAPAPVAHSEAAPAPKPKAKGSDSLDDLLNSAAGGSSVVSQRSAAREPTADDANLPDQLSRTDVLNGMRSVQSRVSACYQRYHVPGTAMVNLVIAKTGHVSEASVGGALANTPTGDCVSSAVKAARFSRFSGASMRVQYPFILR